MPQKRYLVPACLVLLALVAVPGSSFAQTSYDFTLGVMGGIGGATDGEVDSGLGNLGLQLLFSVEKDSHTRFVTRLGSMNLDTDDVGDILQNDPFDAKLTYITLAGEYTFREPSYESGIFIGLGFYDVTDSPRFDGTTFSSNDESNLGLTLGASGDFRISDRWSILGELSGHYTDLDYGRFFVMGHVGVGFHF